MVFVTYLQAGEWVVDSLLIRRCLPLPQSAASHSQALSELNTQPQYNSNIGRGVERRPSTRAGTKLKRQLVQASLIKPRRSKNKLAGWSFIGVSSPTPPPVPQMATGLSKEILDAFAGQQLNRKGIRHYSGVMINRVQYLLGDVVEVRCFCPMFFYCGAGAMNSDQRLWLLTPHSWEHLCLGSCQICSLISRDSTLYVARIEGLWSPEQHPSRAPEGSARKNAVMRCRWFYHPSETGFPCSRSPDDLYLSNHFDDNVSVSRHTQHPLTESSLGSVLERLVF